MIHRTWFDPTEDVAMNMVFQGPTLFPYPLGVSWRIQVLFYLSAAIAMSLTGLWCIWGGLGRQHWFLRVAAVLGWISLGLTIPIPEARRRVSSPSRRDNCRALRMENVAFHKHPGKPVAVLHS